MQIKQHYTSLNKDNYKTNNHVSLVSPKPAIITYHTISEILDLEQDEGDEQVLSLGNALGGAIGTPSV